ncbi:MAG TPA: DUF4149 domain-containing protein [Gemmatimonadaceae bacterium]|nr:DUF4149 domain-containing protein [Gemmatimonadaceae bacterium]
MSSAAKPSVYGALTAALWFGAAWLFAVSVAPSAFDVLPHGLAGALVSRVLPPILVVGMVIGFGIAIVDISFRRWAGVVMGVACALDRYGIVPRVGEPGTAAFGRLHAVSVALYGIAALAALVVVIAAWRSYGTQYRR